MKVGRKGRGEVLGLDGGLNQKRRNSVSFGENAGVNFSDSLEDIEIRDVLNELEDIGKRLSRYPAAFLLARYRQLIGYLLQYVLNGIRLKRNLKWRRSERSVYVVIERTEGALEELEQVLGKENQRTRTLELMEEIKGCLISLLL